MSVNRAYLKSSWEDPGYSHLQAHDEKVEGMTDIANSCGEP